MPASNINGTTEARLLEEADGKDVVAMDVSTHDAGEYIV